MERRLLSTLLAEAARQGVEPTEEMVAKATTAFGKELTGKLARDLADELISAMPAMLQTRHEIQLGFEERLNELWGKAFDLLETMIVASMEVGIEFDQAERPGAAGGGRGEGSRLRSCDAASCAGLTLEVGPVHVFGAHAPKGTEWAGDRVLARHRWAKVGS